MNFSFRKTAKSLSFVCLVAALSLSFAPASYGQSNSQPMQASAQVSMTLYQLKTEADGRQYVVARDGSLVPLPPPGMTAGASQVSVYGDKKGNFWYQAPNGSAVAIHDNRITWNDSQSYAKSDDKKDKKKSRRDKRKERRRAFLGAATGAAVGTAMTNAIYGNYNGVPYGYPMYGTPSSMYYLGPNGTPVYINADGSNLNSLYSQWNTQQQLVQQNRLQYQNQAQQSALQFQQQAQQNSLQHQQARQANNQAARSNWASNRQENLSTRQNLQQGRADTKSSARSNWRDRARAGQENRAGLSNSSDSKRRFGRRFSEQAEGSKSRFQGRFSDRSNRQGKFSSGAREGGRFSKGKFHRRSR